VLGEYEEEEVSLILDSFYMEIYVFGFISGVLDIVFELRNEIRISRATVRFIMQGYRNGWFF